MIDHDNPRIDRASSSPTRRGASWARVSDPARVPDRRSADLPPGADRGTARLSPDRETFGRADGGVGDPRRTTGGAKNDIEKLFLAYSQPPQSISTIDS